MPIIVDDPTGAVRYRFGSTGDVVTARVVGGLLVVTPSPLTFYDAQVDGTQYVDLSTTADGSDPVQSVRSDRHGSWEVYGPPGVPSMWLDDGNPDTPRVLVVAPEAALAAANDAARAEQAADRAEAVGDTNDAIMASVAADPGSAFGAILSGKAAKADLPLNARDFGAVGDGTTDDADALTAWLDAQVAQDRAGYLPAGTYRTTRSLTYRDTAHTFRITTDGAKLTRLYGDFVGAGQGILDLSGYDHTSNSHRIAGLGFLGNGIPGDPVGLLMEDAWLAVIDDISAPFESGHALANSALLVTNDNNSKYDNIHSQSGWQPKAFDIPGTVTASVTAGSTTVAASDAVFTAAMVGQPIYFNAGSDTGDNLLRVATITAYTNATTVTTDTPAPSTQAALKIAVGHITGSVAAGSTALTLGPIAGLSQDYVGMQVHVLGASVKTGSSNAAGVLSTRIAAVDTATRTLTLEQPATSTVTSAVVLFAPSMFLGSFEGDTSPAQTNHSWWGRVQLEGFPGAGIIVNNAYYTTVNQLKVHGAAYPYADDWAQCYYPAVFSEVKDVTVRDMQAGYGIMGTKVHVSGSRGVLTIDGIELARLRKDRPGFMARSNAKSFRLVLGEVYISFDRTGFPAGWRLTESDYDYQVQARGSIHERTMVDTLTIGPAAVTSLGATAVEGAVTMAAGQVVTWRPPGRFGMLAIATTAANAVGMVHYRTSEQGSGPYAAIVAGGSGLAVISAATTLTGTTGTSGTVTVAPDAAGNLQIENRLGFTTQLSLFHVPFGT